MSGNTAWVTLATNDSYCLGALVLANSLKRVNTVHQLAVLITPGVSQPMRQQLAKVFNVVKEVDVLDSGDEANLALIARPELGVTFTKLHCWNLTQFSKCVFLDADILVVQNCDELFERGELSAAPDVGWPDCFNSGVFVFVPSKDTFKALIDCALAQGSFDGGDQGLLNIFFKDWPTKDIKKHLPFIYNMVSTASYSYLPAFKLFGSQVKIVHFIGSNKPWLQSGSAATSTLSGFLETWWNIFNSHVSQTLSTDMAGLAGALAGGERAAIEDVWRRQNWEQGVIDYMGRDSFDNIWKKISESIGSKAAVPPAVPVATAPSTETAEKSSASPAATAETPSQQGAEESTDSAVPPPVKTEQLEGAPVAAEQQAADKTATPLEKKDEVPKTEISKSEPAKEDASSKSEKVDVAEQAKVLPPVDVEALKEKVQDLPKSDAPTTPTKPVKLSEITSQKEGEQPKTEVPIQPLAAVPLPPLEAKTETLTDTKPPQEAKSDVPTETKDTQEKPPTDEAGKEIAEAAVSKQEVPKAEATPPTPTECSKPDTAQPVKEAKSAEEKTNEPEAKESVPSDAPKTEEVKTPPVEVKTMQEAPKETLAAIEKPAKDDSTPKEPSSQAAPKETPVGTEPPTKEDSAPKVPSSPETLKEAPAGPKTPAKDDSAPKVPPSPAAPTEAVAGPTCTAATPTVTPAAPTETPVASPATPTVTPATPTVTPATPTITPATPTSISASAEKSVKDDAASKVPSSPTAPTELPASAEQPKKDDSAPKAPSSSVESKEAPKKDDSTSKPLTEAVAVSKDVASAEVPPPAATPSGPEVPSETKPATESKKSPPTSASSTPQASAAEGASAAAAAPVPPKRKGNKDQKSGNGGKQSKSKK